ncbi:polyprenyl synthetase family protein [Gordonia sp. DT30]|uniref:polyprenyl synthetase family protein n=1 Tax=Gordonia sp. DT30 TaxID=3416546 RepID=UPI003CE76DD8
MSTAPLPTSLSEVPAAAGAVLDDFFDITLPVTRAISPVVGQASEVVADFVRLGGKRVRPTFGYAGWLCGLSSPDRRPPIPEQLGSDALRVCAALELVQACALIHDDIIDHSDTRRGRRTVHRLFAAHHRDAGWSGDADDHGVAAAILAGDLALAWADDLLGGHTPARRPVTVAPSPLPAEVSAVWSAMRTEVLGGQYLDIVNEVSGDETVESAYRVMEFKTAAYTVARPLELGARMAGAPDELLDDLRSVGHDLGIAFQLRDDMLGVFGDPQVTGKPSGDDLAEGKRTGLLAIGLRRADEQDPAAARSLRAALGHRLGPGELARVRETLVDLGAAAEVERHVDDLLGTAVVRLEHAAIDEDIRAELIAMAGRIAHREA